MPTGHVQRFPFQRFCGFSICVVAFVLLNVWLSLVSKRLCIIQPHKKCHFTSQATLRISALLIEPWANIYSSSAKHKFTNGNTKEYHHHEISRTSNKYFPLKCPMPNVSPTRKVLGSERFCPIPILTSDSRPTSCCSQIYRCDTWRRYRSSKNEPRRKHRSHLFKASNQHGRVCEHCPLNKSAVNK